MTELRIERGVAQGRPIHTRILQIDVSSEDAGHLRARGVILDLRKCGFVPTGGDLQTAGFIHHMSLDVTIERASSRITALTPTQQVVAFEASPDSAGESCRDTPERLKDLIGERIDAAFPRTLSNCYGGALGCTHLLTLAQLVGSTLPHVLGLENALEAEAPARLPGEPIFKRTLVIDGLEVADGREMDVAVQLTDIQMAPRQAVTGFMDRFRSQHEVRVLARIEMETVGITSITVDERQRTRAELATAAWQNRDTEVAQLIGSPALMGVARKLLDAMGDRPELRPLLDTMLNFAPGLIQCMAAMAHRIVEGMSGEDSGQSAPAGLNGFGGMPNACYIWREGGPLGKMRRDFQAPADASDPPRSES
jgi:hypothetical protein